LNIKIEQRKSSCDSLITFNRIRKPEPEFSKKGTVLFCRDENILKQELLIATNKIDDTYKEIVNSSNEKYTLDPNVIICTKVNKEIKIDIRYGLSSDILNKISKFH